MESSINEWEVLFHSLVEGNEDYDLEYLAPIQTKDTDDLGNRLGLKLSGQLLGFLNECNGIRNRRFNEYVIWPLCEMINSTIAWYDYLKKVEIQQAQQYFFFADNGCGEHFGYRVTSGEIQDERIWIWEPIFNDYTEVATDLKDWAIKRYTDMI